MRLRYSPPPVVGPVIGKRSHDTSIVIVVLTKHPGPMSISEPQPPPGTCSVLDGVQLAPAWSTVKRVLPAGATGDLTRLRAWTELTTVWHPVGR